MSVIFIFIDGLGLGSQEESNPFFVNDTPFFTEILEGSHLSSEAAEREYRQVSLLGQTLLWGWMGFLRAPQGRRHSLLELMQPKSWDAIYALFPIAA